MEANATGLRLVLARNRLQQKDVAEALGVTRMAVWSWVDGRAAPNAINLLRLLEYLRRFEPGLQADDLVDVSQSGPVPADPAPAEAGE